MPLRPARPCSRCGQLIRERDCPRCTRPRLKADNRPSAARRGYDRRWRQFRAQYLAAHPNCRRCNRPATEVHHRKELRAGGAKYDPANLEPLCKRCHSRHTASRGRAK